MVENFESAMTTRRLSLDGLELLDAIERSGSFSGAAELLHKATSTVSYAVGKLEQDLGVTLFHRHGPRVVATPAGRELLVEGRHLLIAAQDLECRVKRVASGWESELRIAVDALLPLQRLEGLIERFCAVAPDTRLKLMAESLMGTWERLLDGDADLVVAVGDGPAGGGWRAVPLAEVEFAFCVSPTHPLASAKEPLAESEVKAHRLVVVSDSARRLTARTVSVQRGQATLCVPDMRTKHALQVAGLGVGFLPVPCARSAIGRGALVAKAVRQGKPRESVHVAWRSSDDGLALSWWRDQLQTPGMVQHWIDHAADSWDGGRGADKVVRKPAHRVR